MTDALDDWAGFTGDHPVSGDPAEVIWEGDGKYTPACHICNYRGVRQDFHAQARQLAKAHTTSARHKHQLYLMGMGRKEHGHG